jgi:hypothetical protein
MTAETDDKTISIAPSWLGMLPALIAIIEHGTSAGRATALQQLRSMATAADRYNQLVSFGDPVRMAAYGGVTPEQDVQLREIARKICVDFGFHE